MIGSLRHTQYSTCIHIITVTLVDRIHNIQVHHSFKYTRFNKYLWYKMAAPGVVDDGDDDSYQSPFTSSIDTRPTIALKRSLSTSSLKSHTPDSPSSPTTNNNHGKHSVNNGGFRGRPFAKSNPGPPPLSSTQGLAPWFKDSQHNNHHHHKTGKRRQSSHNDSTNSNKGGPFTLWEYLLFELHGQGDSIFTEEKTENLLNVVKIPLGLERVVAFGLLACLDSFLYTFTILPLRICYAFYTLCRSSALPSYRKSDLVKGTLFTLLLTMLLKLDTSKIYHGIRGQAAMKLYVMFNVLEIADKLCSALGQDIMECLYSKNTTANLPRLILFACLAVIYGCVHSLVLLYQIITLNVAVNSYSNALLTLLLSNQFAEIKSAVFKKFERENLFQLTCADITERFQLSAMLLVIGTRNVVEVNTTGIIPLSWAGWNRWLGALFGPAAVVVGSEIVVDWLKHAYVTKFNNIRPKIYQKFLHVLAVDYAENSFSDQIMTKRTGLPVYPLATVFVRMLLQSYSIYAEQTSNTHTCTYHYTTSSPAPSNCQLMSEKLGNQTGSESILESLQQFLLEKISYYTSPSILYFSINSLLAIITIFTVLLAMKLVLGSMLFKYTTSIHSAVKYQQSTRRAKKSQDQSDYVPQKDKGYGVIELDDKMRSRLYDPDEEIPSNTHPNNTNNNNSSITDFGHVTRFKMVAKRIW